jgi:hypothetical protein
MAGLALVAAAAIAAAGASSATALPEWGQCFKKGTGGKFTDANCTKKATLKTPGEFEWRKGAEVAHKKFTAAGGTGVLFVFAAPGSEEKVECVSVSATGEATGAKTLGNVLVTFKGCELLGTKCENQATEGEITVRPLKGTLGYIHKASKEVGVLLTPVKTKGEFAEFVCSGGAIHTTVGIGPIGKQFYPGGGGDAIISPITPVNQMTPEFTQVYSAKEGKNIPERFEGGKPALLETQITSSEEAPWFAAGEEVTTVATPEEAVEIKA